MIASRTMGILNLRLLALLLAAALPAQRNPFFATVTGTDDKPLANAVVTCVSTRSAINPWPTDTVVTRTNERGQARCYLLPGRIYVTWGVASEANAGKHQVTSIARLISCGRVVTLKAVESQPPRAIKLNGLAEWREAGAKSVRWYPDRTVDHSIDLDMPEQETVTIPVTPWSHGVLAVCDARGVMVCVHVETGSQDSHTLRKPKECTVNVFDDEGEPIANATLTTQVDGLGGSKLLLGAHLGHMPHMRQLGVTDALGQLSFLTPELQTIERQWGALTIPMLVFASHLDMHPATVGADHYGPLRIDMGAAKPLEARIEGRDAAAATMVAMGTFSARPTQSIQASGHLATKTIKTTKTESSWQVHGLEPPLQPCIQLARKRPTVVLSNAIAAPRSPLIIDLDARTTATVAVTHKDTGPAACVLLVGRPTAQRPTRWEAILATDSSGHADLLLDDGEYFIYAVSGTSHGLAMIDADTRQVDIELTTLKTMTVRCVDADGKPIEGARARGDSTTLRGRVDGTDLKSQWTRMSTMMIWHFLEPCRSGADGRMELPTFVANNMGARAKLWIPGNESKLFRLRPGTELDVVIQ
jgi:hypothetical protein